MGKKGGHVTRLLENVVLSKVIIMKVIFGQNAISAMQCRSRCVGQFVRLRKMV